MDDMHRIYKAAYPCAELALGLGLQGGEEAKANTLRVRCKRRDWETMDGPRPYIAIRVAAV